MAVAVSIDSVSSADAAPPAAPYRISKIAGHDRATVKFTPTTTAGVIRAWRVLIGGAGRTTGRVGGQAGAVCGIAVCGTARPLALPSGTQITEDVTFVEASDGGADGARTVSVYAWSDTEAA